MGKSTISMAIFNSYVKLPEGTPKSSKDTQRHPKTILVFETHGFGVPPF